MKELSDEPRVLAQTIETAVADALGNLPARLEQLEMEVPVLRDLVRNTEMLKESVPLKEKKKTPEDGVEPLVELEERLSRLELNCLEDGLLQISEDLEARVSRLEVARLEEAWAHATEDLAARVARLEKEFGPRADTDTVSNASNGVVAHPTWQPSRWSDVTPSLANSASAPLEGAVQPGTNGSQSRLQQCGSQHGKSVMQEAIQPRIGSRHVNKAASSQKPDVPASPRSIPTPSFFRESNDNLLRQRGPSQGGILDNQFPSISANLSLNGVPVPMPTSLSGHQRVYGNV